MRLGRSLRALGLVVAMVTAACGEPGSVLDPTSAAPGSDDPGACTRQTVAGCTMLGIRFDPPLSLDEALAVAADLGGVAIAVYRTDAVCVPDTWSTPVSSPGMVASRFAYVDAAGIRERRVAAVDGGLAPPISGWHISQAYWDQWEREWSRAQASGVEIEGIAVWLSEEAAAAAASDPRAADTAALYWRWTDSLDPSYPGELLMDGKGFPGLSTPSDPGC